MIVKGAVFEGFARTAFPQASAAPAFQAKIITGMFQGMIAAQTPSGFLTTFSYPYPGRSRASPGILPHTEA